jgi:hypothetical protein
MDKKLDALDPLPTPIAATDLLYVVRSGGDYKAVGTDLPSGGTGVAVETHAATGKTTPANDDEIPLVDSADSWSLKKLTWTNAKATLKTYFDTLYSTFDGAYASLSGIPATFAPANHDHASNKLAQANTHESPDTDAAPTSLHHTLGTGANNACAGNDARLSDARTPAAHDHAGNKLAQANTHESPDTDAAPTSLHHTLGTGANNACAGNDARLSDTRDPKAHALAHKSGGGDAIKLDELAAPTDVTTLDASTTAHGLALKVTAPAAGMRNVHCVDNTETARKDAALFVAGDPAALGTAAAGTALTAARSDHVHAMPAATALGKGAGTSLQVLRVKSDESGLEFAAASGGGNVTGSDLTSGVIIIGGGSSAIAAGPAPGTSGNVLTSNGSAWTSAAPAGGGGGEVFDPGWDGQGQVITGEVILMPVALTQTLTQAALVSDVSGSVTVTVKKYSPDAGVLGEATTLGTVALSSAVHVRSTGLSWGVTAGDVLEFTPSSITAVKRLRAKLGA